jgi:cytochrome bd-type quinol oxidase subunit 1
MDFDPVLLARLQFAFTIIFHIIFPSFTIGLSAISLRSVPSGCAAATSATAR